MAKQAGQAGPSREHDRNQVSDVGVVEAFSTQERAELGRFRADVTEAASEGLRARTR